MMEIENCEKEVLVNCEEDNILISTEDIEVKISKITGLIKEYKLNNENILKEDFTPYYFRQSTNNDRESKINEKTKLWRNPNRDLEIIPAISDMLILKNEYKNITY